MSFIGSFHWRLALETETWALGVLMHCYQSLVIILIRIFLTREFKVAHLFIDSFFLFLYLFCLMLFVCFSMRIFIILDL